VGDDFAVTVAAGSLRDPRHPAHFPHRWTAEGVTADVAFTGAHVLHLSVAACVLNDVYREAQTLGLVVDGVRVVARGRFDTPSWASSGITYSVEIAATMTEEDRARLLDVVDQVAEIPKAIRAGAEVRRV
jgi:uncharacterized OsmC-like protein